MFDIPPKENRKYGRRRVFFSALGCYQDGNITFDCTIRDISANGCRILVKHGCAFPSSFYLINIRESITYQAEIAWRSAIEAGLAVTGTIPLSRVSDSHPAYLKRLWAARALR
jgi:hypothetical protein